MLAKLVALVCLPAVAFATLVSDTIYDSNGQPASGIIQITPSQAFTAADSTFVAAITRSIPIVAGVINYDLKPNTGSSPAGTSYIVIYRLNGMQPSASTPVRWTIPASGPVRINQIEATGLLGASSIVGLSQLSGASNNAILVGIGTTWTGKTVPACTDPVGKKLFYNTSTQVFTCETDATGAGSGITTLNTLTATTQTFSKVDDTNVTLAISSVTANHAFTMGWTGTLAKARQNAVTAYTDQANSFSGLQTINPGTTPVQALLLDIAQPGVAGTRSSHFLDIRGTSFDTLGHNADWRTFVNVTSNAGASTYSLQSRIDAAAFANRLTITDAGALSAASSTLSNNTNQLVLGTTNTTTLTMAALTASRTFTLPDANSNPVQPSTAPANQFATAISAAGVITWTQPAFSNLSGAATLAQLPFGTANQLHKTNTGGTAIENATLSVGTAGTDFAVSFGAGTITLNLPDASGANRGAVTTGTQTLAGAKTFTSLATLNLGTTPAQALLFDIAQPGVAGTRSSHFLDMRGTSFDTLGHNADWRTFTNVTSNAGASELTLQSRIDAGAFATRIAVTDQNEIKFGASPTTNRIVGGASAGALEVVQFSSTGARLTFHGPTHVSFPAWFVYDGAKHQFRTASGAANLAAIDTTGLAINANTAFEGLLTHAITAARTWTFPDVAGTVTLIAATQTLSNKTLDNTNSATLKSGSFTLQDTTTTTKQAIFDLSNITAATTRTVIIPDANSNTVRPSSAGANQFATGVASTGIISYAQPAFSNLSGAATLAQLPFGTANQLIKTNAGATSQEHATLSVGTTGTDFAVAFGAGTITLNLPDASAANRGAITTGTQTIAGVKTFTGGITLTGALDNTGASSTKTHKQGLLSARPATCAVGDTYFSTDATAGLNVTGCTSTNVWTTLGDGGGSGSAWSAITNPTGVLSLSMGATHTSTWTVAVGTGTADMFVIQDTTANTGTGHLLDVHSVGTSTMKPIRFTAGGTANGVEMDSSGNLSAIGTGRINASSHALLSATHSDTVAAAPVLGDIVYANVTPAWTKLAGNITTTRKVLTQKGTGTISAVPSYQALVAGTGITVTEAGDFTIAIDTAVTATLNTAQTFTAKNTFQTNAAVAGLRYVPSVAPTTTLVAGDMYVNSTTNDLNVYDGVAWQRQMRNPFTAIRDILYSSDANGTPARLADPGGDGYYLGRFGGALVWRLPQVADVANAVANNAGNTYTTGIQDFESATVTRPFRRLAFASFPATCTANREFLERSDPATAGQVIYVCNAAGTGWDLVGDGGGGGGTPGGADGEIQYRVNGTTFGGVAGSANSAGNVTLNSGTTPADVLTLSIAAPGVAGTRNSHNLVQRGASFDTAGHTTDWKWFVNETSNAGASTYTLQSRIDAAAYANRLTITDAGALTSASATLTNNTNQLVIGTTNTTTITMAALTASRTFTLPDANSNPVQPSTAGANQFATAISAAGVVTWTQPAFSNISGTATKAQLPATTVYTDQTNTWTTGTQDFEAAAVTRPFRRLAFASFPGTCTANREFLERSDPATAGQVIYVCNAAGTGWDLVGDGGGGGSPGGTGSELQYRVNGTTFGGLENSSRPNAGEILLTTAPAAVATRSVVGLGGAITGGNANGTFLSINSAAAYTGDFLRIQLNGTNKVNIDSSGNITGIGEIAAGHATDPASGAIRITNGGNLDLRNSGVVNWSSTSAVNGTKDIGFERIAAGLIGVTDGGGINFREILARGYTARIANEGVTGTTVNMLAKLTGAPSTAIKAGTGDTEVLGIVVSGAGTTGDAKIAVIGRADCIFDGATTAGNYVKISAVTAGNCADAGATRPTSNSIIGRVLSTNAAAGTYTVFLFGEGMIGGGGGGGLGDPGGNGVVVRTALNTTINRTITGTTNRITVTNGDGVSGNPTLDVGSNFGELVAAGTAGQAAFNAGTAATAARSDHRHRTFSQLSWFFPGTPATGVQNMTLVLPEGITSPLLTDMRITVNTTSAASSSVNIQRCTASCTGTTPTFSNIYVADLSLAANTRTVAKAAAPDQNVSGLAAGDQFKVNLVTVGASLADVTVTLTYKQETTN